MFYEAVLRLRQRDGTHLRASYFIEAAEKEGLAPRMDLRALELALDLMSRHPKLKLAVNVSGLTVGDATWLATWQQAGERHADLSRRLIVEITETAMIDDLGRLTAFVRRLRDGGTQVAIDDFGTGYTSFRHLRTLEVDILKIDSTFVSGLTGSQGSRDRAIVAAMIAMADALDLTTVVEGVDSEAVANLLEEAGATYLQGYLYGQPSPPQDFANQDFT